jgi:hypothetical protein
VQLRTRLSVAGPFPLRKLQISCAVLVGYFCLPKQLAAEANTEATNQLAACYNFGYKRAIWPLSGN